MTSTPHTNQEVSMRFDEQFEALWQQQEFEVPDAGEGFCRYAQSYSAWATQIILNVESLHSLVAVNHGVLRITHKYFEWRMVVPKHHRNRIGESGHRCIFHVYEAAYLKLKIIELGLQPPPLAFPLPPAPPPPSPPPPPPIQIAGIFFGEEEE